MGVFIIFYELKRGPQSGFCPKRVRTSREQDNMGYRHVGLDETRLSVYTEWLQRAWMFVVFPKNWKKGAWHAILARFDAKTEFGYYSNGDRVNTRGNAQIRATTRFFGKSS